MCSRPPRPPSPPPARPTAPAPEKTAKKVGKAPSKKKNQPGSGVKPRGGTSSLQIQPLKTGSNPDLNL